MIQSIVEAVAVHGKERPFSLCIADDQRSASYEEYFSFIYGYAMHLKDKGVKRGDRVVVQTVQAMEFTVCGLAVQLLGAVFVPVEKQLAKNRFKEIIEETESILHIAKEPVKETVLFENIQEVLNYKRSLDGQEVIVFPKKEETAEILFTTGTTGSSKGIELTHESVTAVAENIIHGLSMEQNNIELIPIPLSHSHGLRRYYGNMYNGSSAVITDGVVFTKKLFALIEKYKVTSIDLVPAALAALFRLSGDAIGDYRDQLSYIQIGSAAIGEEEIRRLKKLLPYTRLYNFYGSTESGCSSILEFGKVEKDRFCIGKPTKNAEFIFVDEFGGQIRATKENPGFLACRGAMNMKGYYNDPELTSRIMKDGYIYSNDLAYMDEEGCLYLLGRKGDVIECGGQKIAPEEVEDVVLRFPGIKDCACVPYDDPVLKSVPKLFYARDTAAGLDEQRLREHLRESLEAFKVPKIMEEISEIPRTYNGKLQRNKLKNI